MDAQPTLSELLDRTRSQSVRDAALARLYVEMEFPVRKYVFAHMSDTTAAAEVIGDIWAIVSEIVLGKTYIDRGVAADAVVITVARNLIRAFYRNRKAALASEIPLDHEINLGENDPSLLAVEAEVLLAELLPDPIQRDVFSKILAEYTLVEIAAEQKVSYSTMARIYKRALERCREVMAQEIR